jgi:hypothetical protein
MILVAGQLVFQQFNHHPSMLRLPLGLGITRR